MRSAKSVASRFGENLSRCREGRGLSRSELGRRAGIGAAGIGVLERGAQRPRIDIAVKLAGALEVPACELLRGIEWRPSAAGPGEFATYELVESRCHHAEEFGAALRASLWDLDGEGTI